MNNQNSNTKSEYNQCDLCKKTAKTWIGSDIKCAFKSGVFNTDNWNCRTANALRENKDSVWSEDQRCAALPIDGKFIIISWYKSRGRVEGMWLLSEDKIEPLKLKDALEYLNLKG